jgi:gentisate 1,2-dioxygenase
MAVSAAKSAPSKAAPAKPPGPKHNIKAARQAYYDKISRHDLTPLWEVLSSLVTKEPHSRCVPAHWKFKDIKQFVLEAGDVISAEEATRRVLILENPAIRGKSQVTNTLFAGVQMILPGEIAPAHQHVSSAIRFVLDGDGAYTAVNGEKTIMAPGDFVITANWAPHDHGNNSKKPMMWLDVLDMPTVNHFETSFANYFDDPIQTTTRQDGDSFAFYGSGVLPDGTEANRVRTPVINYAYAKMRPILERLKKTGEIDKRHGVRVRYVNPTTGGWVLPTMGAHLALLPKGFKGEPYRSTDGTLFVCAEGQGSTKVGDEVFDWSQNDIFVVPPWVPYAHSAAKESVLFSISDRPAQEALGIWREAA